MTSTVNPATPIIDQPKAVGSTPTTSGPSKTKPPLAYTKPTATKKRTRAPANAARLDQKSRTIDVFDM